MVVPKVKAEPPAKRPRTEAVPVAGSPGSVVRGLNLDMKPEMPALGSESKLWEAWYDQLVDWVRTNIPKGLQELGINVESVKNALPTRIQDNSQNGTTSKLTTFRANWNVLDCVLALETANMYENCGTAHWLNARSGKVVFGGAVIFEEQTPWAQVTAALHCWSWDRYLSSSEKEHLRRLIFPVVVPTACFSKTDAEKGIKVKVAQDDGYKGADVWETRPIFENCPIFAGRAHLLAWHFIVGECLSKWDEQSQIHFTKLLEASDQSYQKVSPSPTSDFPLPWKWGNFSGSQGSNWLDPSTPHIL